MAPALVGRVPCRTWKLEPIPNVSFLFGRGRKGQHLGQHRLRKISMCSGCNRCSRPNGSKVVKKNERYVIKFLIRQGFRHNWSFIFIELKSFFTLFPALHNDIHWKRNWQFRSLIRSTLVIQSVFGIVGHCSDLFVSARSSLWRSARFSSNDASKKKNKEKKQPRNSEITPELN